VLEKSADVKGTMQAVTVEGPAYGIVMNPVETKVWWPQVSPDAFCGLPLLVAVGQEDTVRLLGAMISGSPERLRDAVSCKAEEACAAMIRLVI
jgi:hypothetical protein